MIASLRSVPTVHPMVVSTALAEAQDARSSDWAQARLISERGLRARADGARQILASAALGGGTWEQAVEAALSPDAASTPARGSHPWWAALGRMTTMHATSRDDVALAATLFDMAEMADPQRPFGRPDYLAYVQVLWDTGAAERIPSVARRESTLEAGEASFIDLNQLARAQDDDAWIDALNHAITVPAGLVPIAVDPVATTPFDGLMAPGAGPVDGGPRITVIMSTYRRGAQLLTAISSVLAQTWTDLELIVIDDCSGPGHDAVLDEAAALDERVTVIRQSANQGTYMARNRALQAATGEFVTFQDDDDWSHPQRLERQVAPMLADPSVHSTLSHAVQADDDLVFRYAARRTRLMNSSSLMFRRRDLGALGGFDTVRKGADTEFIRRLTAALPGRQDLLPEALAFVRLTSGSLSRGDFRPGWNHPTRSEYAEAADWWHRAIRAGASARIDGDPRRRSFPAPARFLAAASDAVPVYDLVVVADLTTPLATAGVGWELVTDAVERGERVGVIPLDHPFRTDTAGRTRVTDDVRRVLHSGAVQRVFPEQPGSCGRLVIDDAALLEICDQAPWAIEVEEVAVVCQSAPAESSGSGYWSLADCTAALAAVLPESSPTWIAAIPEIRSELMHLGVLAEDSSLRWSPRLAKDSAPGHRVSEIPVVGRVGSRRPEAWPARAADIARVYAVDGSVDVRTLGDTAAVLRVLDGSPATWLRYTLNDVTLDTFLRQLDAYVHVSSAAPTVLEMRVMLRALDVGTPVLLACEVDTPVDGAVVRCAPHEVPEALSGLRAAAGTG